MNQRAVSFEGQILQVAGERGADNGIAIAHSMLDGAANALIRLQGTKEAARFAFALSDRIVDQVERPIVTPSLQLAAPVQDAPPAVVASPASRLPSLISHMPWHMLAAWFCGFAVAAMIFGGR